MIALDIMLIFKAIIALPMIASPMVAAMMP